MFRNSLTIRMIYFKRIKYIMIQKKNSKESKCSFPWRSFKPSNCLWKLNERKYYLASLLSFRRYFSCFIKSFHSLYHHTPRCEKYLDYIDIYLILTHIKTILIQDMLSLFRRKICTARKRVAEQKFAGQRLLPGHWSM